MERKKNQSLDVVYLPAAAGPREKSLSHFYGLSGLKEAQVYLQHPVLGKRLVEISQALLAWQRNSAYEVIGSPDDMKLKSSMTLFAILPYTDPVFEKVLHKFFKGKKDGKTLELLGLEE